MKQNLITDVIQGMLPYLNNAQTERLQEVLQHTLFDYEVTKTERDKELSEQNLVESFLSAKRIEGCSEKTLKFCPPDTIVSIFMSCFLCRLTVRSFLHEIKNVSCHIPAPATSALYAAVRILTECFYFTEKQFPVK